MLRTFPDLAAAFVAAFTMISDVDDAGAQEPEPLVFAERNIGGAFIRVVKYEEQWSEFVPGFGDRNWRSVLCVEVQKSGSTKPSRVWQRSTLGQHGFAANGPFVLSNAHDGPFVMAYGDILKNRILWCQIPIDGAAQPLPAEMRIDPATRDKNWENSPVSFLPKVDPFGDGSAQVNAFWKTNIGVDLKGQKGKYQIELDSIAKTATGWRIDAYVRDRTKKWVRVEDGVITGGPDMTPVVSFAIRLDEECNFHKVEVIK